MNIRVFFGRADCNLELIFEGQNRKCGLDVVRSDGIERGSFQDANLISSRRSFRHAVLLTSQRANEAGANSAAARNSELDPRVPSARTQNAVRVAAGHLPEKQTSFVALVNNCSIVLLTASSAFTQRLELLAVPFTDAESPCRLWQFAVPYPPFNSPLRNAEELSDLVYV